VTTTKLSLFGLSNADESSSTMEATLNRVGETEDFDNHSVSLLMTVRISNQSKGMEQVPQNPNETDTRDTY
jgi:hypothetical protein